jgi:hypothetical protein
MKRRSKCLNSLIAESACSHRDNTFRARTGCALSAPRISQAGAVTYTMPEIALATRDDIGGILDLQGTEFDRPGWVFERTTSARVH